MPSVTLTPTLDQIQEAINATAKKILSTSKKLRCWGMTNGPPTYYDLIARDKEVVKVVLLLTGSIEGTKQQVAEYMSGFDKYSFLWTQDLQVRQLPVLASGTVCMPCTHAVDLACVDAVSLPALVEVQHCTAPSDHTGHTSCQLVQRLTTPKRW